MANIRVNVDYTISDGCEVKFNAPDNSDNVSNLIVYYPNGNGETLSKQFIFVDAQGNDLGNLSSLFSKNALLSVTLDVTNSKAYILNSVSNEYLDAGLVFAVTTGGTGSAYTASVLNIKELKVGATFVMIPHVVSNVAAPTLNVNNLGAKDIRRRISGSTLTTVATGGVNGATNWLGANRPVLMTYDGNYWIADVDKPNLLDGYGTLPIEKGGTGSTTAESARAKLGIVDETWTFTLEDGSTVTKAMYVG